MHQACIQAVAVAPGCLVYTREKLIVLKPAGMVVGKKDIPTESVEGQRGCRVNRRDEGGGLGSDVWRKGYICGVIRSLAMLIMVKLTVLAVRWNN